MCTDAEYLVALEEAERKVRKEEEQNNLVRTAAKEIAGNGFYIMSLTDANKYCKKARNDIRRLRSLGFKVTKNKLMRYKLGYETWFVSQWVVTLP